MHNFNVDYIVKEEEGVVVCIISDCNFNAVALVDKYSNIFENPFVSFVPDAFLINDQYKGVAKCSQEDTFNEEYGKKLAYRKAYLKYVTALEKKVNFIANEHKKAMDRIKNGLDKAVAKIDGKTEKAVELYVEVLGEA